MENERDRAVNNGDLHAVLICQTLSSWRFLLLMVLPPMTWVVVFAQPGFLRALTGFFGAAVCYGCWRLWLDSHYFKWINTENNQQAGTSLSVIWKRHKLAQLSLEERQEGALRQLRQTGVFVAMLWGLWLITLGFWN